MTGRTANLITFQNEMLQKVWWNECCISRTQCALYELVCSSALYELLCASALYELLCASALYELLCASTLYELVCASERKRRGARTSENISVYLSKIIVFLLSKVHFAF